MAGTSSAKTHSCAGARPRRNRFCEDTALLIHNRLPDPLRKRVLRLIGKGAVVVGQVRIALTNAAASGDRRPTLLHGREAAESYSARTVLDAAVLARARGSGCRHGNPSQRERRSGGRGGYFQKLSSFSLCVCVCWVQSQDFTHGMSESESRMREICMSGSKRQCRLWPAAGRP